MKIDDHARFLFFGAGELPVQHQTIHRSDGSRTHVETPEGITGGRHLFENPDGHVFHVHWIGGPHPDRDMLQVDELPDLLAPCPLEGCDGEVLGDHYVKRHDDPRLLGDRVAAECSRGHLFGVR